MNSAENIGTELSEILAEVRALKPELGERLSNLLAGPRKRTQPSKGRITIGQRKQQCRDILRGFYLREQLKKSNRKIA